MRGDGGAGDSGDTGADTLATLAPLPATFSDPIDVQAAAALLDFSLTVYLSTDFSSHVHSHS